MAGSSRGLWAGLLGADGPGAVVCIRVSVGLVFLSEGIQKFLYPDKLGPGRFDKIGIPAAPFFANLDGVVEIVCGTLIVVGLLTRLAAIPLLIDIILAIVLTKLRELGPGGFQGVQGFWGMAHDARTDFAMLCGLIFLLWIGPGHWSIDAIITRMLAAGVAGEQVS